MALKNGEIASFFHSCFVPLETVEMRAFSLSKKCLTIRFGSKLFFSPKRHLKKTYLSTSLHKRNPGRQIQLHDRLVAHLVQMTNNTAEGVAVRSHEGRLAGLQRGDDHLGR